MIVDKFMKMKRLLFIALTLVSCVCASAVPSAAKILETMRSQMLATPAVEALFTINGGDGGVQGSMTVAGASFVMSTPQLKVWYDGKTQWTYLASSGEVSITEPTKEELTASNPFAILSSYATYYKARRLNDNNGRRCVELTPVSNGSGIESIVVIADQSGKWPQAINIKFDDGRSISLVVDSIKGISKPAESILRYDAKLQPATEIIDLR